MKNTRVIAISGASGAGKTAVIKQLASKFNSPYLLFDDYTNADTYPDDMKKWYESSANVSEIQTPGLVSALENLISKSSSQFIFVEEPFGRERDSMKLLIDYVVLLEQPLELCLARIMQRQIEHSKFNSFKPIADFLEKYHDHMRDIYISAVNQVRGGSDLNINDVASIKDITIIISQWLKSHAN